MGWKLDNLTAYAAHAIVGPDGMSLQRTNAANLPRGQVGSCSDSSLILTTVAQGPFSHKAKQTSGPSDG
jgi:hypothetical protein